MALTILDIKNAKPQAKNYVLRDERGLYLEVSSNGGKWWRLRYTFNGKENRLSLGTYPDVSLKDARERRDKTKILIAQGINPSDMRKRTKSASANAQTFEAVAREWAAKFAHTWTDITLAVSSIPYNLL